MWIAAHLDVDEVCNEGHEDHLLSIPTLLRVCFDLPLQFPPLSAVSHENLPGRERERQKEMKNGRSTEKKLTTHVHLIVNRAIKQREFSVFSFIPP